MRRAALLVVLVFVLVVFTGIVVLNSLNVVERVTYVDNIEGTVEAKEPGAQGFRTLQGQARILAGTVVRTGRDAGALLHWADGSELRAGPQTTLTVMKCQLNRQKQANLRLFRLDVGRVVVHVLKALTASSKFEIRTPTATAGVRGTQFAVEVRTDGATEVLVYEGNVAVDCGGKSLGVDQGQALAVSVQGGQTSSRQLRATELKEWEKEQADEVKTARVGQSHRD